MNAMKNCYVTNTNNYSIFCSSNVAVLKIKNYKKKINNFQLKSLKFIS